MSGGARKRKSLWDSKEDNQPPNHTNEKNSYHEKDTYSSLHVGRDSKWAEADNELVSKDDRWSSLGPPLGSSYRDDGRDFNDLPPTRRGLDGDKRYHVSPSFDGQRQQNSSRSPQNNLNHSRRFRRSRSRSQSRSRSGSRGRGRSRSRERMRGRSRDRGRVSVRSRSRSRSPQGDYRREPQGYNDRRSGSGLSSQPCRDFAAGDCRRGSQCRFLHQKNLNDRDGGRSETNQSERWRSRQEQGGNYYDGEKDEPSKNSYKPATVCTDFQKGRCTRGSQCRFLHDDGFGDRIERGSRNMPFEHNYKQHSHRSDIALCKFFMMGKCQRDNCRFSHAAPVRGDQDDRRGPDTDDINKTWKGAKWDDETLAISGNAESTGWDNFGKEPSSYPASERHAGDRWDHSSDDMKNQLYGPKRGDEAIVLESTRSTGWGNNDVQNFKLTSVINTEKCSDNRWDHHSNDKSTVYGDLSWKNKAAEGDENISPHLGAGGTVNEAIAGSVNLDKSLGREEITLTSREDNKMQEASNQLPAPVMHAAFPDYSQFQQHPNAMGGSNVMTDYSSSANGVHRYGNVSYPALVPGQNGNQNSNSFGTQASGFGGINQSQGTTFGNPSNIHGNDSYEAVQQHFSASDLQNQTQMQHEESSRATVTSGMPQKTVNGEQVSPLANITESLKHIHENLPQLFAALNPQNSAEVAPPVPDSAGLLSFTPTNTQTAPAAMAQKQYDPIGDSLEPHKLENHNQPPQVLSNSGKHVNEMALEPSAPSSAVTHDAGKLHNSGFPGDNNNEKGPESGKDKPVTNSVLEAATEGPAETHKQELQTTSVKKMDADAKNGDGSNGKDDKTMRQFKVALVEFVKEILKPKWKEGHMSRDVHKTIVKKVVDKVTSTIQGASIPKTQEKIDQYLSYSKPKLAKLVEAYTERFSKSS